MTGPNRVSKGTATLLAGLVLFLVALTPSGQVPGRSPAANTTAPVASTVEGMYTETHTVHGVDGQVEVVQDILEAVPRDPTHIFFRIVTHFDNGASCGLSGIAAAEHHAFVYRGTPLAAGDRACILTIEVSAQQLHATDRIGSDDSGTCRAFCGARGSLSNVVLAHKRSLGAQEAAAAKNSFEFGEAVDEFNTRNAAGPMLSRILSAGDTKER